MARLGMGAVVALLNAMLEVMQTHSMGMARCSHHPFSPTLDCSSPPQTTASCMDLWFDGWLIDIGFPHKRLSVARFIRKRTLNESQHIITKSTAEGLHWVPLTRQTRSMDGAFMHTNILSIGCAPTHSE
eukprot:5699988-Amphidinium_carterae.1